MLNIFCTPVNKVNFGIYSAMVLGFFLTSPVIQYILASHRLSHEPFEVIPNVVLCLNRFVGSLICWHCFDADVAA